MSVQLFEQQESIINSADQQRYRLPDGFYPKHTLHEVRDFVARYPWGMDHIFRALPPKFNLAGMRVLDLGCGVTLQAVDLIEKYKIAEYHGIDPDRDTFYGGHNNYDHFVGYKHAFMFYYNKKVNFYCSVSEDMPFPDNHFDFVFAFQTTEHVQDILGMCQEVRRVLKPGGYFYATHHNFYCWCGHHQGPYFIRDLPGISSEQKKFQHWHHLDMDIDWSEPHHLNRIRIPQLEEAFRKTFRIITWRNDYTQPERGSDLLTPEILEKYAGKYDYEDLGTTMVEIVAKNEK